MMKLLTLNDVIPDGWTGNGIFTRMKTPIWSATIASSELDMILFTDAGDKIISPLVRRRVTYENPALSETDIELLAKIIQDIYAEPWKRRYAVLSESYKPIDNYNMKETESVNGSKSTTISDKDVHSIKINETVKDNGTVKAETDNKIFGFNSTTGKDSDSATGTNTTDMTNTHEGTNSDTIDKTGNHSDRYDDMRTLSRSGNIGVTTSQQMLQSEIDLWQWNFYKDVIVDVMNMLTLSTY